MANFYYQPVLSGWVQAFVRVFFFLGLGFAMQRLVAVHWQVDPMVWGCSTFLGASVVLLLIGGKGELALDTLKRPHTWIFGGFLLLVAAINTFLFQQITTTEASLLHRITLIVGFVIGWFFLSRAPSYDRKISMVLVGIGLVMILSQIPADKKFVVYTAIMLIAFLESIRIFIAEFHPENTQSMSPRARCRLAGVVMSVTSILFLGLTLLVAYLQSLSTSPVEALPELSDFANRGNIYGGFILGILFMAPLRYLEFSSIRLIKAENTFAVAALAPLAALLWESLFAGLGLLDLRTLSLTDIVAGSLITIGALVTIYVRIRNEMGGKFDVYEYMIKVGAEAQKQEREHLKQAKAKQTRMEELTQAACESREIVLDTLHRYHHNISKAADLLGVPANVIEAIKNDTSGELVLYETVRKDLYRHYHLHVVTADPLTGLKNRHALHRLADDAIAHNVPFALFYIDLDKFKPINDTYGHDVGDKLLQSVGNRLESFIDDADIAARLGGDEFALIMHHISKFEATTLAKQLGTMLAKPYSISSVKEPIKITASIGFATFPEDGRDTQALLKAADNHMYRDKAG